MTTMVGPRRRAREVALQILIQMDVNPELGAEQAMRLYFDHLAADADDDDGDGRGEPVRPAPPFDRAMVQALVSGVASRRGELDQVVQDLSRNWRLERMALVERNVIRLALYELKHTRDVPTNVVLDEAVELTKKFGTSEGGAFVNGLLERAAEGLRGDALPRGRGPPLGGGARARCPRARLGAARARRGRFAGTPRAGPDPGGGLRRRLPRALPAADHHRDGRRPEGAHRLDPISSR